MNKFTKKLIASVGALALALTLAPAANAAAGVATAPTLLSTNVATEWNEDSALIKANGSVVEIYRAYKTLRIRSSENGGGSWSAQADIVDPADKFRAIALKNGNILVVYSKLKAPSYVILSKTGTTWGISKTATLVPVSWNDVDSFTLQRGANGRVVLTLERYSNGNDVWYDIFLSDDNAETFTNTVAPQVYDENMGNNGLSVVVTNSDKVIITYDRFDLVAGNPGSVYNAHAAYYDAGTNGWVEFNIPVEGAPLDNHMWAWASLSPDGEGFVITWYQKVQSGAWETYYAYYSSVSATPVASQLTADNLWGYEIFAAGTEMYFISTNSAMTEIKAYKSADNGATWGASQTIATNGTNKGVLLRDYAVSSAGKVSLIVGVADNSWNESLTRISTSDKGANWVTEATPFTDPLKPAYDVDTTYLDDAYPIVAWSAASDSNWNDAAVYFASWNAIVPVIKKAATLPKIVASVKVGAKALGFGTTSKSTSTIAKTKGGLAIKLALAAGSTGYCKVVSEKVKVAGKTRLAYKVVGLKATATKCKVTVTVIGAGNYTTSKKTVIVKVAK